MEIKLSTLEDELKRLRALSSNENNSTKAGYTPNVINAHVKNGLSVNSISKTYDKRKVVNEVSMKLQKGEAVGLLGPNGAGKTTCFYMIAGLIDCDERSILLDQSPISHLPMHIRARKGIGYLPQESSIFKGLTVEQNILSVLEILNYTNLVFSIPKKTPLI